MSNIERTGWRDTMRISARHRQWGVECHACDVDFLLVEHCYGVPCALVEYKALGVNEMQFTGANYAALRFLGDAAQIPVLIAVYDAASWGMRVFPLNGAARLDFDWADELTEREWVAWLHRMRQRQVEARTLLGLGTTLPRPFLRQAG